MMIELHVYITSTVVHGTINRKKFHLQVFVKTLKLMIFPTL